MTYEGEGNYWDLQFHVKYRLDRLAEKDFIQTKFMIIVGTTEFPYWCHEDYSIYKYLCMRTNGFDVLHFWENIGKIQLLN